jgi:hypothetical protein
MEKISSDAELRYRKKYYYAHRDEILAKKRRQYAENPEKYLAENKRYRMTHDRSEYDRQRYLAKKVGAVIET